jgi:tetratricopeptide (TPR) repeat protein
VALVAVLPGAAGAGPASGPLSQARAEFSHKRYAETLRALAPLLSGPGVGREPLILATRSCIRLGELDRARGLARRLLSHPDAGAEGPYYAGMVESSSGAYDKAVSLYARALAVDRRHRGARRETVRALSHLGRAAVARGDPSAARRLMERARRVDPGSRLAERNLALIELHAGRPEAALAPLRRVLGRAPDDPLANRLLGRALAAMGKLKLAQQHLQRAVAAGHRLGPAAQARTLMVSGAVRALRGKTFSAMVDLTQAMNLLGHSHPKLLSEVRLRVARVRAALGLEYLARGDEEAAWRSMRGALAACAGLPASQQAEIRRVVFLGATVRGKTGQVRQLLPGVKVDVGPVLRATYRPVAAELVQAYIDYHAGEPDRRLQAAASFTRIADQVGSPGREKLMVMARRSRLRAAALHYDQGAITEARKIYRQSLAGVADPPLAWRHNSAVLDYAAGHRATAIAALRQLKAEVPFAACNLGVFNEQAYIPGKAYRLFKECKARGAAFPGLDSLFEAKRRVFERRRP